MPGIDHRAAIVAHLRAFPAVAPDLTSSWPQVWVGLRIVLIRSGQAGPEDDFTDWFEAVSRDLIGYTDNDHPGTDQVSHAAMGARIAEHLQDLERRRLMSAPNLRLEQIQWGRTQPRSRIDYRRAIVMHMRALSNTPNDELRLWWDRWVDLRRALIDSEQRQHAGFAEWVGATLEDLIGYVAGEVPGPSEWGDADLRERMATRLLQLEGQQGEDRTPECPESLPEKPAEPDTPSRWWHRQSVRLPDLHPADSVDYRKAIVGHMRELPAWPIDKTPLWSSLWISFRGRLIDAGQDELTSFTDWVDEVLYDLVDYVEDDDPGPGEYGHAGIRARIVEHLQELTRSGLEP